MRGRLETTTIIHDYWLERGSRAMQQQKLGRDDASATVLQLIVLRLKQVIHIKLVEEDSKLTIRLTTPQGTHCHVLHDLDTRADHLIWLTVLCVVYARAISGDETTNRALGKKAADKLEVEFKLPSLRTIRSEQRAHWAVCLALGVDPVQLSVVQIDDILTAAIRANRQRPTLDELLMYLRMQQR